MTNTAKQIIDSILIRVGLGENTVPDPFSSPDLEIKEIINLLNDKIQSLTSEVEFTELKKIATFEVVEGKNVYPFSIIAPSLKMFSPKTFVNMTNKNPLTLLTDEEWLNMEMSETKTNGEYFMVFSSAIHLYPDFAPKTKIKFFYYSKYAVMDKDGNKKESFTSVSDVSLLPAQILIWAVSAAWLKSKGFATAESAAEFTKLINRYLSMNKPGELVHLSGSPLSSVKLNITPYNWEI